MHEPRIVSLAIMGVTRHRSHIPRSPRGITSRGLTRSDDLSPASWELLPCFAAKVRHGNNRTLSKLPSAMKLLPHNATCHEACHSYHLIFHGTGDGSCQQPELYRLYGVVTSSVAIPFSAHFRSTNVRSYSDHLPLATGSGTKAMAEAMRAKKVAICLYMVAIEG